MKLVEITETVSINPEHVIYVEIINGVERLGEYVKHIELHLVTGQKIRVYTKSMPHTEGIPENILRAVDNPRKKEECRQAISKNEDKLFELMKTKKKEIEALLTK